MYHRRSVITENRYCSNNSSAENAAIWPGLWLYIPQCLPCIPSICQCHGVLPLPILQLLHLALLWQPSHLNPEISVCTWCCAPRCLSLFEEYLLGIHMAWVWPLTVITGAPRSTSCIFISVDDPYVFLAWFTHFCLTSPHLKIYPLLIL